MPCFTCYHRRFADNCSPQSSVRPSKRSLAAITLCMSLISWVTVDADQQWVHRRTDSAASDLISELLALGMIDTASRICDRYLAASQTDADAKAKWIMESTRIKIAAMLHDAPEFALQKREQAASEIDHFLADYPIHPRSPWLQFQRELIEIADTRRAVLMAIIQPAEDPLRDQVLKRIIRVSTRLEELSRAIEDHVAMERSKRPESLRASELVGLALAVANRRIDLVMLQGELFPEGTADFIASANQSLAASRALLDALPQGAQGRAELLKQIAESLRRTGEPAQAVNLLSEILEVNPADSTARALAVRVAIDMGDLTGAENLLGNDAQPSTNSNMELDLARLQLLIAMVKAETAVPSQREIADWIERIGNRHGDYARRRAEQWVLSASIGKGDTALDPRIIIAHAAGHVRDGRPQQAGEWLASAARSTSDPAAAFQLAIAGAAALRRAEQIARAAELLREVSLAHFNHPGAAKLHLQSAMLLADHASADVIIEHLQECLATWPKDATAASAVDWLVRLHEARGELVSAAIAASTVDPATITRQRLSQAGELWLKALQSVPVSERELLAKQAVHLISRDGVSEFSASLIGQLSTLFGDRDLLNSVPSGTVQDSWLQWLQAVRQRRGIAEVPSLEAVDPSLRLAAADRLIVDGETSKLDQMIFADAILSLLGSQPSLQVAQAYAWKGDWDRCESILAELQQNAPANLDLAQASAGLLTRSDHERAKRAGLRRWMQLSTRLQQGTDQWHAAKLAAIEVMQSLGDLAEAKQLANYVLLTQPPGDATVAARYRRAAGEP